MSKKTPSIARSSTAEYLTFIAATGNQETSVDMRYADENIWLTQKMLAVLYDVSVPAINQHLKRIFADSLRRALISDCLELDIYTLNYINLCLSAIAPLLLNYS